MRVRNRMVTVLERKQESVTKTPALSSRAAVELRDNFLRICPPGAAQRLWDRIFTVADRLKLGSDLAKAYADGGTVAMWIRLHPMSVERATCEIAQKLGFISVETRDWLFRELGEVPVTEHEIGDRPIWDPERRELRYRGRLIRRVSGPNRAKNIVKVLTAFQESGWPPRIDDPLPNGRNQQRLHATIHSLNNGSEGIIFSADGTGEGYAWNPA